MTVLKIRYLPVFETVFQEITTLIKTAGRINPLYLNNSNSHDLTKDSSLKFYNLE